MNEILVFAVLTLAVYRVQRLFTRDDFPPTAWPRHTFRKKLGDEHPLTELFTCPWCLGLWFSLATFFVANLNTQVRWWPLQALAASGIIGLLDSMDS